MLTLEDFWRRNPKLLLCPSATQRRGPGAVETLVAGNDPSAVGYGGPRSVTVFPLVNRNVPPHFPADVFASYGENCWAYNPPADVEEIQGRPTSKNWRKLSAARRPTDTPLFADAMWRGGGPDWIEYPPQWNGQWRGLDDEFSHFAMKRHGKGTQLLFFDGSARNHRVPDLWRLKWHKDFITDYPYPKTFFLPWMY